MNNAIKKAIEAGYDAEWDSGVVRDQETTLTIPQIMDIISSNNKSNE